MALRGRYYGSEYFPLHDTVSSKGEANHDATRLRKRGYKVRVTKKQPLGLGYLEKQKEFTNIYLKRTLIKNEEVKKHDRMERLQKICN